MAGQTEEVSVGRLFQLRAQLGITRETHGPAAVARMLLYEAAAQIRLTHTHGGKPEADAKAQADVVEAVARLL